MSATKNSSSVYIPKQSELFKSELKSPAEQSKLEPVFSASVDRLAVIEASAGTGKTFALVELVMELVLEQGIPLKSILLVTFTEKATSELRLRLRTKIRDLLDACEKDDSSYKTIPEVPFWEIDTFRKKQLKASLLDFDSAPVYTIHGFCKRILREFAFENRQLFEQQLCDTKLLFPEVFRRYLRKELLSKNTPASQLFALYVKHCEGKLETLEKDILDLLDKDGEFVPNLPDFDVFLQELTECWNVLISQDLKLRKQNLTQHPLRSAFDLTALNGTSSKKTMSNLERLLETLGAAHSGASSQEILADLFEIELSTITTPKCRKTLQTGEQWLSQKEFPEAERKWLDAVADCEKLISKHNFSGGAKLILKAWVTQQVLVDVRHELAQTKLEQGVFDFDDLLRIVEEQVIPQKGNNSVTTPLTKAVRKKYVCAIVDEFQDTDRRQWNIFRQLFLESPEHRLIVIGDPKQAIYSFRGADIFTYLRARKTFEQKTARPPFTLKTNFRSSEKMLSGLNQIFCEDSWFPEKRGISYQQVGCGKPDLKLNDAIPGRNAIHLLELLPQFTISGKKIVANSKLKTPKVSLEILSKFDSLLGQKYFGKEAFLQASQTVLDDELAKANQNALLTLFLDDQAGNATARFAEEIAQEIKSLLRKGSPETERPSWQNKEGGRPLLEQDICVLFRKSNEGEILGKALRRHGIDFAFYKQKGLFAGREAQEILDLLEAVAHPVDHSRTAKLLLTRFFGVNIHELTQASTWDADFLHQLQEWKTLTEARRFRRFFDDLLQRTKLVERELLLGGDERSVTNYVHLFEVLNRQVLERHLDLQELIQLLRRYIEGKEDPGENENLLRLESERNSVQLMTMHAAKGLEFPVVFLFGGLTGSIKGAIQFYHDDAENPIIDLLNSKIPEEHEWQVEAERQRLLYVAMTRAGGRLYLPYVGFLQDNSGRRICKVDGGYGILNEQLTKIREQILTYDKNSSFSSSIVEVSAVNSQEEINPKELEKLRLWKNPDLPEIPTSLAETKNPDRFFSQLRYKKRGFVVSSFSRMKKKKDEHEAGKKGWKNREQLPVEARSDSELGQSREDDEAEAAAKHEERKTDPLPGGTQTGNLLHEILEHTDFTTMQESNSPEDWVSRPAVRRQLKSCNERYGRSAETVPRIAEIIWNTLRTPIKLGNTTDSPELQLAYCKRDLREADFYFPIPNQERSADIPVRQTKINVEGWQVEKGFLRGSIDFLFEHEAKIYLLDWKSNLLENYDQQTLASEVMQHYELQLQIYTLATSYWFKLDSAEKYNEKFGGVLYLFLRGMAQNNGSSDGTGKPDDTKNSGGEGVFFKRPSWAELKGYENRLSLENY